MFTGVFLPGLLMILQVYFGEDPVWSVLIITFTLTLNGAVTGGYLGNALDIAPNFSGIYHIIIVRTVINVIMVINVFQARYLEWPILCRH